MKSYDLFIVNCLPKFDSYILYVIQFIYYIHRTKIFADLQQGLEDCQISNWQALCLVVFLQQNLQQFYQSPLLTGGA